MPGLGAKFPSFTYPDRDVERGLNGIARQVEMLSQFPNVGNANVTVNGNGAFIDPVPFDPTIPFYNADSANAIPAYGIALLNGTNTDIGTPVYKTKQPDTYGCQTNWLLNGPVQVPASSYGAGQAVFGMGPCGSVGFIIAYDPADGPPAAGDRWGPRAGTYLIKGETGGFVAQGVYDSTNHLGLFIPEPMTQFDCGTTVDIQSATSQVANITYRGSDTGATQSVWNRSSCVVKAFDSITAIYSPTTGEWRAAIFYTS